MEKKMTEPHAVYARTSAASTVTTRDYNTFGPSRLSWQGIIAGVVTALAVQTVLGLVGTSIGLGLVHETNPGAGPSANSVGLGAALWTACSMLAALYYGGFIAARVSRHVTRTDGVVQGVVVWATTLLITATVLSSAVGSPLGGTAGMGTTPTHNARPAPMGRPMAGMPNGAPMMDSNGAPLPAPTATMAPPNTDQARSNDIAAHEAAKVTALAAVVFLLGAIAAAFGGRLGVDHANESMYDDRYTTRTTNLEA
jgi:hypothetical protein